MTTIQHNFHFPKPVLIFTGGTISAEKDPDHGHLSAKDHLLDECAKEVGFDLSTAKIPYGKSLDSIAFNTGLGSVAYRDYPRLLDAVIEVLDKDNIPVICGGTDTKAWYSTLLVKDLMRLGKLKPNENKKVIFLSSMKTYRDKPELVKNILIGGKLLTEKGLSGGFAITAADETGKTLAVHDVLNQLDKIAPDIQDAFRSACPVGEITIDDPAKNVAHFTSNPNYRVPTWTPETTDRKIKENPVYAYVAPPLLQQKKDAGGQPVQTGEAILAYLEAMSFSDPPFAGMLIEGLPSRATGTLRGNEEHEKLVATVKALTESGRRVVFCNQVRFDAATNKMSPAMGEDWDQTELAKELKGAGAEFVTGLPKDIYLDMFLPLTAQVQPAPVHLPYASIGQQEDMWIRYIPDKSIMTDAMKRLASSTKNIIISGMPNAVLPNALEKAAKHCMAQETSVWRTFEYNGATIDKTLVETGESAYLEGRDTMKIVPPVEQLFAARATLSGKTRTA